MTSTRLDALLGRRHSTKAFSPDSLDADVLFSLLSTVFGTGAQGRRTYGSALARYAVTASIIVGDVSGMTPGAYDVDGDALARRDAEDHRAALAAVTLDAPWLAECPALIVLTVDLATENEAFAAQGPTRGERFAAMEAGMIAQTVHLVAESLGIGTALIAGLDHPGAHDVAASALPTGHTLLGIMPLGYPWAR
ncbi:nitroreductase family protein [Microbacterium karelineae]|uniref:nitroreductase family protein n=1 Tax=Microbacterium karelineae TaxID=2654283 RepID=UPI0018D4999F|nr:nitroreductase family protein [Microbacterium karelineae]